MLLPPPNVTGALHIGHALTGAIQDAIARYRRMSGYSVKWIPGTDHAGISTQIVVERALWRDIKKTRHDLGRESFLQEAWKWKAAYEKRICSQLKALGISLDWSSYYFTFDKTMSSKVIQAFVRLHEDGIIYRDSRIVHWCPSLKTTLSDIEVDYFEANKKTLIKVPGYDQSVVVGVLHRIAFPVHGDTSRFVEVQTLRPETMFGDVAVAVHPKDDRYKDLIGCFVDHPVRNCRIPIIADEKLVDPLFGSGAVKVKCFMAHDCSKEASYSMRIF